LKQSLLNVSEVSSFLQVHPKTIYEWKRQGKIPFIERNGLIRFKKEDIEHWLDQGLNKNIQIKAVLPSIDSLETYDRIYLKGRSALGKSSRRWHYGFGGVFTRKTKSGCVRWNIWYYDENRKRKQKVIKNARGRREAVSALNTEVTKAFSREYLKERARKKATFKEFSSIYLENYARPKKRSWKSDKRYIDAQLTPFFGEMELSEITPLHINQFMVKRQRDGVKNSTINRELTVLKKMLNLAFEWGFEIKQNPVKKGNFFPEDKYRRERVLTYDEEKRLFEASAPHLKPILTCGLSTAMRYSEILGLKWENVDLEKRQIFIKAESSKSGKARIIPVNDTLFAVLVKLKKLNNGVSDFVFLYEDPKTNKLRPVKTVRRAFVKACRRAEIKNLTFHDLRHTVGSRLISKGADPVSVQHILGHANLKTTEIYLHSSLEQMKEAVELLDEKSWLKSENLKKLLHICGTGKSGERKRFTNAFFSVN
jgi:excisionase family DNA binding protein